MKEIDNRMLSDLTAAARANPRLRQHLNLHDAYDEPCQRLLIAMEPDSYIQPHRHLLNPKIELFVALRGRLALLVFSETGEITRIYPLATGGELIGAEVPPGVWHAVVSLSKGAVFLEVKPGPFEPLKAKDMAPWAPAEGSAEAGPYLERLVDAGRSGGKSKSGS